MESSPSTRRLVETIIEDVRATLLKQVHLDEAECEFVCALLKLHADAVSREGGVSSDARRWNAL